ncbi:peptidase A24 family protein [Gordonia hirsuta DSM 44140 = NBRC 16056]|uniref:Peptidase A24 family protein n=1 Tax=Gordonia hirsuta DSM 44140 = NBRC 16056 TaxID=1121927 RepID=L7LB96_9ACTN|nr:A24 family peptidase [Gordonia hirsuta]GAC57342.1 peptidase A24 family protein [Gordonia hirsuta DSM 44140 = NBRC 16056]
MAWIIACHLLVLADVDRRTGRLPHVLMLPLLVISAIGCVCDPAAGLAATVAAAPYLAGFIVRQCGGGDVKLAACCGAFLGSPVAVLVTVLAAALLTVAGCVLSHSSRISHGPALVLATLVVAFG